MILVLITGIYLIDYLDSGEHKQAQQGNYQARNGNDESNFIEIRYKVRRRPGPSSVYLLMGDTIMEVKIQQGYRMGRKELKIIC